MFILLIPNSSKANINDLNYKLLEIEQSIDKCLETKKNEDCQNVNLFTTLLIDVMGNENFAKLIDSNKCKIGTKCGATISRISGKWLKLMDNNLSPLFDVENLFDKNNENSLENFNKEKTDTSKLFTDIEIDAFKAKIYSCWSIPLGLPYDQEMIVRVGIEFKQDGYVSKINFLDSYKLQDAKFKVLAESVERAIRLCEPFNLPEEKYDLWKYFIVNFNATDVL